MKVDIAVIGGGPAGSSTALRLAEMGYEVALFDRAASPKSKPCGEFLNPEAARLLSAEFGVELPKDASPMMHASLIPPTGEALTVPLLDAQGEPTIGYSLPRIRTDALLLEAAKGAGVAIHAGANVRKLTSTSLEGQTLDGEPFACESRLVIACDGSNSLVARQRGLVKSIPRLKRIGIVAHFSGVTRAKAGVVHMYPARNGTWGVAGFALQAGGQAVLSAVVPTSASEALCLGQEAFLTQMVLTLPGLPSMLDGAALSGMQTIPSFGHKLSRAFDDGVLFVGDAARFVDPFTGEGVHHALAGALLAADTARTALKKGDVSTASLASYGSARRELNGRYAACDLVQAFVNRPWMIDLAIRNLRHQPRAAERLFGVLVDVLPSRALYSPLVVAGALIPSFR